MSTNAVEFTKVKFFMALRHYLRTWHRLSRYYKRHLTLFLSLAVKMTVSKVALTQRLMLSPLMDFLLSIGMATLNRVTRSWLTM